MQLFEFFILSCIAFIIFFFSYWLSVIFFEFVGIRFRVFRTKLLFRLDDLKNKNPGILINGLDVGNVQLKGSTTFTSKCLILISCLLKFISINLSIIMYPEIKKVNYFQIFKFRKREFYFWSSVLQK